MNLTAAGRAVEQAMGRPLVEVLAGLRELPPRYITSPPAHRAGRSRPEGGYRGPGLSISTHTTPFAVDITEEQLERARAILGDPPRTHLYIDRDGNARRSRTPLRLGAPVYNSRGEHVGTATLSPTGIPPALPADSDDDNESR